jgi:hypothetical protein
VFERFTRDARTVVVSTQDVCRSLGVDEVRPVHLLLALTEDDSSAREVLTAHGLTPDAVSTAIGAPRFAPSAPLDEDDAAALRSLGIDLDAIREAVDQQFGDGALEAAAAAEGEAGADGRADDGDLAQRRLGRGRHVRFGRGAKKVLELSLREAVREHSREIRSEHIALAVLRTDDDAVRMLLAGLGVDVRALRADLEGRGRRTA